MEIRIFEPDLPPPDIKEILRYSGVRGECDGLLQDVRALLPSLSSSLKPLACYAEIPVSVLGDQVHLGPIEVRSKSLLRLLSGANRAILLAATVGLGLDREILRLGAVSATKQLFADAFGTERVEAICDSLCNRLVERYPNSMLTQRFSAGYGDLPLELQRDIFALLDCPRKIGLTLNESLMMSPSKSVTAIVGIIEA